MNDYNPEWLMPSSLALANCTLRETRTTGYFVNTYFQYSTALVTGMGASVAISTSKQLQGVEVTPVAAVDWELTAGEVFVSHLAPVLDIETAPRLGLSTEGLSLIGYVVSITPANQTPASDISVLWRAYSQGPGVAPAVPLDMNRPLTVIPQSSTTDGVIRFVLFMGVPPLDATPVQAGDIGLSFNGTGLHGKPLSLFRDDLLSVAACSLSFAGLPTGINAPKVQVQPIFRGLGAGKWVDQTLATALSVAPALGVNLGVPAK